MSKMRLYSGKQIDPLNMTVDDICIEDIAHSLSLQCRFGGHCSEFYSVAQHSICVSVHVAPKNAMWGLLHDASEAYLLDVITPLKESSAMAEYREAEKGIMRLIAKKFGLKRYPVEVKLIDFKALATEARDFGIDLDQDYPSKAFNHKLYPQNPQSAERSFFEWYDVVKNY